MKRVTSLALLAPLAAGLRTGAAAPFEQVFRGGVTAAVLDVIVNDERGQPVTTLTKDDFDVVEDGSPREVLAATFVSDAQGVGRTRSSPVDVWTNAAPPSRLFAIVIDDLDVAPSEVGRARSAARRFIDAIPDAAAAAVVFCGQQRGLQEFTTDKARLRQAVDHVSGRRPSFDDEPDTAGAERAANASRAVLTLQSVAESLALIPDRRKAIVFITAGASAAGAFRADVGAYTQDLRRLLGVAMRGNVAIYPVDYRGLTEAAETDPPSINGLRALAAATGGTATTNTNDLQSAFGRIIRDSADYYLVAYAPADQGRAGQRNSRPVRVSVSVKGLTVRSRSVYFGDLPKQPIMPRPAADLLSMPLSAGPMRIAVNAAAFAERNGRSAVYVITEVAPSTVRFVGQNGRSRARLDYRTAATDESGRTAGGDVRTFTWQISEQRREQIEAVGTRVVGKLELRPGSYRVRTAVADPVSGDFGFVAGDFDAPSYGRGVSLSSLVVSSASESRLPTVRQDADVLEQRIGWIPTAARAFSRSDVLAVYAEVYGAGAREQRIEAAISVSSSTGIVFNQVLVPAALVPGVAGARCYPVRAAIRLADFRPGSYSLRLTAAFAGRSGDQLSSRATAFTVDLR